MILSTSRVVSLLFRQPKWPWPDVYHFGVKIFGFHVAEPGADNNFNSAWTLEMQKLMVKVGPAGPKAFLKGVVWRLYIMVCQPTPPFVSLNKALLNPYFWVVFVR